MERLPVFSQRLAVPRAFTLLLAISSVLSTQAFAATLPPGFTEVLVASGLSNPTAMQFAPDGRLFVCEQNGRLRVIKNGSLLPTPFTALTVNSSGERGLLGIAFDPGFAANQYVYVYYTATTPTVHNRISRFTANGDVAVAGSELVIFDFDNLGSATNHNGGALAFGPLDGKLYAAAGDNANSSNAQSLSTTLGKLIRLNSDGTIPSDNPFFNTASGKNRAIWTLGLRNPFTFAFNPIGTELFINDVGETTWEEINEGVAGANYGWPATEGTTTNPSFKSPQYAYGHSNGCAITGGAFYSPSATQFPSEYVTDYFFADYCGGWIRRLDRTAGNTVTTFATGIAAPVDLKVAEDGSLYYLARDSGAVYQVRYGSSAPSITSHPVSQTVAPGASVTFTVRASGAPPLQYQWLRNGVAIPGAIAPDYTMVSVAAGENGARFRARVTNNVDTNGVLSNEATLTVSPNQPPTGTIVQPAAGSQYGGGTSIAFSGTGVDAEDGSLGAAAFTWRVDLHHDTHSHPFLPATTGSATGSFVIPTSGETSANVWYRIYLTVTDSGGRTHTSQRDIFPYKVVLTLASNPPGLQVTLDGQPVVTPYSFDAVVGITRSIGATATQSLAARAYNFASWSDGGALSHTISTPAVNRVYTVSYQESVESVPVGPSITLVQRASKDAGTTSSSTLAFSSVNTVGNWIAVAIRSWPAGQSSTVSDTRGNVYRSAVQLNETVDGMTLAIYYAENIAGGANTVTVSNSIPGGTLRFAILRYSGVARTNSLDAVARAQGASATVSSGTASTTANGNLVIGLLSTANPRALTAGSGYVIQETVPAAPNSKFFVEDLRQGTAGPVSAGGGLNSSDIWGAVVATFRAGSSAAAPDLTLSKTHVGSFGQGTFATYLLVVGNAGAAPTSGQVTLTDTLPSSLSATALVGTGWTCTLATLTCTRSDALGPGASYPAITLTVSVANDAPASVTNTAAVSGGGDTYGGNNAASDVTSIIPSGGGSTDTQPPTAPGGLTATASQNQIDLTWSSSIDNVGVTGYRVEQCQGAGCTNFTEIGLASAASAGASVMGPLRVSANPNYFQDPSGTPLVLNGSHTWNNLQDWGTNGSLQPLDFDAYVDFLVAHGHNFTLLWYIELPKFCGFPTTSGTPPDFSVGPHPWQRTGPGNATDGGPKFDLSKFNQAYFDRLRTRVQALKDAGIYVGVYTFTAEWVGRYRCSTDGYPFTGVNNVNGINDGGGFRFIYDELTERHYRHPGRVCRKGHRHPERLARTCCGWFPRKPPPTATGGTIIRSHTFGLTNPASHISIRSDMGRGRILSTRPSPIATPTGLLHPHGRPPQRVVVPARRGAKSTSTTRTTAFLGSGTAACNNIEILPGRIS